MKSQFHLRSARERRIRRNCVATFAPLLLLLATGCKVKPQMQAEAAQDKNPAEVTITPALQETLKFGMPEMAEIHGTLQVAARVETNARHVAHVGSPVAGRILKLLVFEGDRKSTRLNSSHSSIS